MRLVLMTAILGLLIQPAFAKPIDCQQILASATYANQTAHESMRRMTEITESGLSINWTEVQRKTYDLCAKQVDEAWKHMEMFANVYSAFCK